MKLDTFQKLYVHQLKDLFSAENQLIEAIPAVASACHDKELKAAFENHLKETKSHVQRIESIFEQLDFLPGGHRCAAMEGLIKESQELLREECDPRVLDAALIAAAQRIEHYEMAGYGTARAYAEKLGDYTSADTLQKTLNEEGHADQLLTRLAERSVNFAAMQAAS